MGREVARDQKNESGLAGGFTALLYKLFIINGAGEGTPARASEGHFKGN
jgi:hypothetical protein